MTQIVLLISGAITIYSYALIIYIFMSWVPGARESQFGMFMGRICELYLVQFSRFIPPLGMIDISPIVAILVLHMARVGIFELVRMIGM